MRAAILFSLAAIVLAATAAEGQPSRSATPGLARQPPACASGKRRLQADACSAARPWRCQSCPHGVRTLRIVDKCGAPIQLCRKAVGK